MRLPADAGLRLALIAMPAAALAGCGIIGTADRPPSSASALAAASEAAGPAADYPMVLGEPVTVDGSVYTPADVLNYDSVGLAAIDGGAGVTIAHLTLPLPSYVEVTSLTSGKTILARVERRGPMTGAHLAGLSTAAATELGVGEGDAIRVRRVNPPEKDRFELRSGRSAAPRIDTPKALIDVLRRKLPTSGSASLVGIASARPHSAAAAASHAPPASLAVAVPPEVADVSRAPANLPAAGVTAYPLPPLAQAVGAPAVAGSKPVPLTFRLAPAPRATSVGPQPVRSAPAASPPSAAQNGFVVQAGTFSLSANAERAAKAIGGVVVPAGKLYRVRTEPFASRQQAEAALAKVRAAGYSDARVYTAG